MKPRHSFAWMDFLWLAFLAGLAALRSTIDVQEPELHKYLILLLIGVTQIFENRLLERFPNRGRYYSVILKILLGSFLVDHTGKIESSYFLIYLLPAVTAAMYFDLWGTLIWTALTCMAYWSFVVWELNQYELTGEGAGILAIRSLFFFLAAIIVNRFVSENRKQATRYRELAETLAETNRRLEQAQEEARRSERLAALGQLSAGLAHELRNPLAVIKGSAETLMRRLASSDPISTEMAGFISSEVNRMNSLVTRFLEFVRPQTLNTQPVQVPALIQRALKTAHDRWPDAKVQVEEHYAPNLPTVTADGELLESVFTNLALNAYEAMAPNGGRLQITAAPSSEEKPGIEITFQDTGPGVPAGLREQIFNPFFTTKETGVGLGLSIVSKILDAHRGWIRVVSGGEKGACFRVFLPQQDGLD